jgi:hypothetical protein
VRGFIVTNRPLALLIVFAVSWLDRTRWNILLTICNTKEPNSINMKRLPIYQPVFFVTQD